MMYVFIALVLLMAATLYLLVRNDRVCDFRLLVLRHLSEGAHLDVTERNADWRWRFDTFDSVSYERCLFSFKRLKASNYWSNLSFVDNYDVTL